MMTIVDKQTPCCENIVLPDLRSKEETYSQGAEDSHQERASSLQLLRILPTRSQLSISLQEYKNKKKKVNKVQIPENTQ